MLSWSGLEYGIKGIFQFFAARYTTSTLHYTILLRGESITHYCIVLLCRTNFYNYDVSQINFLDFELNNDSRDFTAGSCAKHIGIQQ
jgi:hypothetical protein